MNAYSYFSKVDPTKEAIMTWASSSHDEAVETFAKFKDLPVHEFTKIFEVVEQTW